MAKVTWLGEGEGGAEETVGFGGVVFKKGVAVEVPDSAPWLETAKGNQFFKVDEGHTEKHTSRVEKSEGVSKGESRRKS